MVKNHTLRKDLIEAWERYVNETYTSDDLALIIDSIDDEHLQEFNVVAQRELDVAMKSLPPTPEEKEKYRDEFARLFADYENKKRMQQRQTSPTIVRFRKIWYAAAAAILLGLLIPAAYLYLNPKTEQTSVQYVEVITQRGEIKNIVLSDDTKITLNAGSRIKYPANFTGNERPVELYGEALFNVTSDPARPFTVKTENIDIKVVGTVFDVKDYDEDCLASVSVASGKVEVAVAGGKSLLEQNQQLKTDKITGSFEKTTFDADKYLSWTVGSLYFYKTPIHEVVNILNRNFPQADIELVDGEYSFLITGTYENLLTVELILKSILVITDLKCKKTGVNKYILYQDTGQ